MDAVKPPVFLDSPGEPGVEFSQWFRMFQTYILAKGGDGYSDLRLRACLVNCLGVEGQRQFAALENTPPSVPVPAEADTPLYLEAVQKLRDRYDQKKSRVTHRVEFRSRYQQEGESVADFLCNLRELASKADFRNYTEDQAILDQFISHTTSSHIRERLLLEGDALTLQKAVEMSQKLESAEKESRRLASVSLSSRQVTIDRIRSQDPPRQQEVRPRFSRGSRGSGAQRAQSTCFRCGKPGHFARRCRATMIRVVEESDDTQGAGRDEEVPPPEGDLSGALQH